MDYSATGAAKAMEAPETGTYTPININNSQANPAHGTSSKANKSGLQFNTDRAYNLTWTPSCPVQGDNNGVLSLASGANQDFDWKSGLNTGDYSYTTAPADADAVGPPDDGPFDVNVEP